MHKTLLSLPLFQGMTNKEITEVIANKTIRQQRFAKKQTIVGYNQPSKGLLLLLEGKISVSGSWRNGEYKSTEIISSPSVIEPERCFGLNQRYQKQYIAKTACSMLYIPKTDVLLLTRTYMVFKLNLLNIISTLAQQRSILITANNVTLQDNIMRFMSEHFISSSSEKKVYITMNKLAEIMNSSRLEISKALNFLEQKKKITSQRGIITMHTE